MRSKPTGPKLVIGAEAKEETWRLSTASMRTVRTRHCFTSGDKGPAPPVLTLIFPGTPDFVASYLRDLHMPAWIGLSDLQEENQYGWSDGVSPVLYTNWNEKEPNNAGGAVRTCY